MKKLLLILLCLPVIGFGQDDKLDEIVFSNGDTIYGNVIEVGVNNITYRYKGEITNNISKNRDIVKIKYASGRVQNFDGFKVIEKKKRVLKKTQKPNSKLEKLKKSSHSIILGVNTNFNQYYNDMDHIDRAAIGFDLNYSYSLALSSNWRYNSFFRYNHIYERYRYLAFGDMIETDGAFDPAISMNNNSTQSYTRNDIFIGQKIGYIHNEMFSTYIGSSISTNTDYFSPDEITYYFEVEERLSFNKTHFIFINIRTMLSQPGSGLKNSNSSGWPDVIAPTVGYGVTF